MRTKLYAILFTILTIISFIFVFTIRNFEFLFLGISIILLLISIYWIYRYFKGSWKNFKSSTKGGIIGFVIGIILATINSYPFLGLLGALFYIPFASLCNLGEGCWLYAIMVGDIGFILSGLVIGWIVGKIKSRKA